MSISIQKIDSDTESPSKLSSFVSESRGQLSIEFLIGFMVFILVFAALLPTIANQTTTLAADPNIGTAERSLINIIVLLLVVAVVVGIVRRTQG